MVGILLTQIIDLSTTLHYYLGVSVQDKSYVFGDNKMGVDSSTIPHAKLHKRHNALSFHRVQEAIAAKFIAMHHLDGIFNPADILPQALGISVRFGTTLSLFSSFKAIWHNSMMRISSISHGWEMLFVVCYISLFGSSLQDCKMMGSDRIVGMTSYCDVTF